MISFDVFDTALLRNVYLPTDIFKLIEEQVGKDFYNKRIEAEKKAREKNIYYSLDDIYKFLPEFDKELEVQTELDNCKANPKILSLYNPTNCVFISDMYLPNKVIAQMLEKCGYKDPKVFVSWEWKAIKGDGSLFKKVQKVLDTRIEKHYGDNYEADIEGAKRAKIPNVEFSPALHNIKMNIPIIKDVRLKKYVAEFLYSKEIDAIDKIPMFTVPLIVGFTKWVLQQRKPGQKIFFLSRDMIVPYKIATSLLNAEDVYYLHASRRSLSAACLNSKDKKLLDKMGLILTPKELKSKKKEGMEEIIKYLSQFNMKDGDLIVDIGYSGTIQAAIEIALGIKLKGLYMQTFPDMLLNIEAEEYLQRRVIQSCLMVEVPLGSDEDCVEGYKNGKVIFKPEHAERKTLAKRMTNVLFKEAKKLINWDLNIFDVEQVLIHLQYYPNDEILEVFNRPIFSNREIGESVINFDKEKILKGKLRECCSLSYSYKLFKQMLEADPELSHLSRLI